MKTLEETNLLNSLKSLMDDAIACGARRARDAWITWLSTSQRHPSANEACYRSHQSIPRKYRKSSKKLAIVRTIHSILSRKFQNALSEEVGPAAAWLLGLWPKLEVDSGVKAVTPPQVGYSSLS